MNLDNLHTLLQVQTGRHASRVALIDARDGSRMTYAELGAALGQVRERLAASGLQQGDVLTLVGGNSVELATNLLGAMACGVIVNPLNPALSALEMERLVAHSGSTRIWTDLASARLHLAADVPIERMTSRQDPSGVPATGTEPFELGGDAGALLIYTSGTTGQPKGVLLRHANLLQNARAAARWLGQDEEHVTLTLLPLFHTFAVISDLLAMLCVGGTATIFPGFDVARLEEFSAALARFEVRSFSVVPLLADLMLRFRVRVPKSLRYAVAGAAPLQPATVEAFRAAYGVPIIPAYGMTETTCFCTISPMAALVVGSCGVPVECAVRTVDEAGHDVAPGEVGELVVRGPNVMRGGYFKDTRRAYLDRSEEWLCTGDLARIDQRGYVFIVGRKKNMIIRGGEKVYLEDVDRGLRQLQGVADCASVGLSSIGCEMVERFASFIVTEPGSDLSTGRVLQHLNSVLGATKCPDLVFFRESIPRTATGKVRLPELQEAAKGNP